MNDALVLNRKYERTREINDNDKFFIVWILVDGKHKARVGWIEEEFTEKDFIDKFAPEYTKDRYSIIEVISFTDYDEYKEYKLNN